MRNVIVIPGAVEIEEGESSNGEAQPRQAQKFRREGRPLYFSLQIARNWVDAGDAEWLGKAEKRIRLTSKGRDRFLEMKAILSMRGDSSRLGCYLSEAYRKGERWAGFMVSQIRDQSLRLPVTSPVGGGASNGVVHASIRILSGKEGCNAS